MQKKFAKNANKAKSQFFKKNQQDCQNLGTANQKRGSK